MGTCIHCGRTETSGWYQKGTMCKACYSKAQQAKNPERHRAYYRKANLSPEVWAIRRATAKRSKEHNREQIKAYNTAYHKTITCRYKISAKNARVRGFPWELTKEEFTSFTLLPCYYCNNKLDEPVNAGSGLDRINSLLGYTKDNVVTCCALCNRIKFDHLTVEEMKAVAQLLISMRCGTAGLIKEPMVPFGVISPAV